jgi:hypothetical protein
VCTFGKERGGRVGQQEGRGSPRVCGQAIGPSRGQVHSQRGEVGKPEGKGEASVKPMGPGGMGNFRGSEPMCEVGPGRGQ